MPSKALPIILGALLLSACISSEKTTIVKPVPGNTVVVQPSDGS